MNQKQLDQEKKIAETLAGIKNKIMVMSGKGGVGKSSMAVNVAYGLAGRGFKVGLMDIDIHGPSIPQMLGLGPGAMVMDGVVIHPAVYGADLKVASIECMMENTESPVIWRGPIKASFIRQFISDVAWGELDYLVVDSPPGTGDEPLTIAQNIPGIRALIVTTPQEVSLRDVRKSINFCREANMPIMGLVENMSGLRCPHCNQTINLFKTGGGEDAARAMQVKFLGRIPIIPEVVTAGDAGKPPLEVSAELNQAFGPILDGVVSAFIK